MSNELFGGPIAIAAGQIRGAYNLGFFGYNPDIDTGIAEDVWTVGGTYVFPSDSGTAMEIVSTNPADIGMQYRVRYLDVDFKVKDVVLPLNGTTPVPLPELVTRVYSIINYSPTRSAGTVNVKAQGAATIYCQALTGDQTSLMGILTIPADKIGIVQRFDVDMIRGTGSDSNAVVTADIRLLTDAGRSSRISTLRYGQQKAGNSSTRGVLESGFVLPPKTDIVAKMTPTADDTSVAVFILLTLYPVSQADSAAFLKS